MKSLLTILVLAIAGGARAQNGLYEKAGVIQIRDPKAPMSGTERPGGDLFKLTLEDVGAYTGHTCGCDTAVRKDILSQPEGAFVDTALN